MNEKSFCAMYDEWEVINSFACVTAIFIHYILETTTLCLFSSMSTEFYTAKKIELRI